MATDREIFKQGQIGQFKASGASDPVGEGKKLHYRTYEVLITDGGTAGTDVGETVMGVVPVASRIVSAKLSTPVGVTANDTTYKTITAAKRTAGGSATTVASWATTTSDTGNLTAFAPKSATPVAAAVDLAAGDALTVKVTHASTGVAIASSTASALVSITVEEI